MATPQTHAAVVTVGPRAPLETHEVPTVAPEGDEILIRGNFTSSTPLDLHRADGGLLVTPPMILGAVTVGVVQSVGPDAKILRPGDKVFGWAFDKPKEKAHQQYVTAPEWQFAQIPAGFTMEQAATIPENFITVFHTLATDLGLPTPWPKPADYVPPRAEEPILVWGAASSVGQFALEVLSFYGYRHLLATASPKHHDYLKQLGATECFNYRDANVTAALLAAVKRIRAGKSPVIPMIIDCIASQSGSLEPISKVAESGSTVAAMLPVILKHSSVAQAPEYSMEVPGHNPWADGVNLRGVRTHFVFRNAFFKEKLPSVIMPECCPASEIPTH